MSLRAWFELLRVPAILTVPGDALAGAASTGLRPNRGTTLAAAASVCLYEAGMALNDWADRDEDAVDRPHRPIPSGRVRPRAALAAAGALTVTGLALASRAGRPTALTAGALAATVWAYDLGLKRTAWGPVAMGAARGLDVLLGAVATSQPGRRLRPEGRSPDMGVQGAKASQGRGVRGLQAPPPARRDLGKGWPGAIPREAAAPARTAALIAAHTLAMTAISRHETTGGSPSTPLTALVLAGAIAAATADLPAARRLAATAAGGSTVPAGTTATAVATATTAVLYAATAARPYLHATLNPSPHLTQAAVNAGIRALIPLQAALTARSGAPAHAAALLTLTPLARALFRKVSAT